MNAFRNAFRVIANKFGFLWTHIAYYSLVIFLLVSISLSVLVPYINKIVESINVMQRLSEIGQAIIDNDGFGEFISLTKVFISDLGGIFAGVRGLQTGLILFLLSMLSRFALGLGDIAFFHCIDMHLNSAVKQRFRASFIKNLGKSVKYQLCKMLFSLPFDAAIISLMYLISFAFKAPLSLFFAPTFMVLGFVVLYGLRLAFFSGWVPEMLHSESKKIFPAFFNSLKLFGKNFARSYGALLLYMIVAIAMNVLFGIFTLGVGLFFTIPFTYFILTVLSSTLYYQNNNLRYYVDKNTIIN